MNSQVIVTLLGAVIASGLFGAVFNGLLGRRKISAEATEIVTRAAGEQIGRLKDEISDLRAQLLLHVAKSDAQDRKIDRLERRELEHRDLLQVHTGWDWRVLQVLQKHLTPEQLENEQIRPAPPLYPHT